MKLENAKVKHRLLIHNFTPDSPHFFRDNTLYIGYSKRLGDVDQSLLNIPLVSSIISYCWLTDESLEVPVLDEEYVKNMEKLQSFFSDTYRVDLGGELVVKKTVSNQTENEETLVFFSGGLDSTYSVYKHLHLNPRLFMICGYDMYMQGGGRLPLRDRWWSTYKQFTDKIGLKITFAYTNTRWIIDEDKVNAANKKPLKRRYWDSLRHGVCLTGLAAPLNYGNMVVSSNGCKKWDTTTYDNPYGTGFNIAPMLTYAGRKLRYCCDRDRFIKAKEMKEFLNNGVTVLKPCFKPTMKMNCMECEKCLRTLSQIVLAGVDPNMCGMNPPDGVWGRYLNMFKNREITKRLIRIHFTRMQEYLRTHDIDVPKESKKFYDYIREADFHGYLDELTKRRG